MYLSPIVIEKPTFEAGYLSRDLTTMSTLVDRV